MTKPQLVTSTEIKIETGIPVPKTRRGKYPLGVMEVGDSFALPAETRFPYQVGATATVRHKPKKFSVSKDPAHPGLYRCWRVA